jgi:hypothetical protein
MSFTNSLAFKFWRDSDLVAGEVAFLWAYYHLTTALLVPSNLAEAERENVDL